MPFTIGRKRSPPKSNDPKWDAQSRVLRALGLPPSTLLWVHVRDALEPLTVEQIMRIALICEEGDAR
jgi:hypothetical protein